MPAEPERSMLPLLSVELDTPPFTLRVITPPLMVTLPSELIAFLPSADAEAVIVPPSTQMASLPRSACPLTELTLMLWVPRKRR